MSRYRMVHCAIWSDDKFPFLSDDAQLVWFHLYTNEFTTSCGIYKAPLEGLAADKRWTLKRYREGFRECFQQGLVEYDERLYVIAFPRFFTWNRPANPNVLQNWLSAWEAVPRSPLKRTHYQRLAEACKRWGEGFEKVLERFTETLPPTFEEPSPKQEQEQEQEKEQEKEKAGSTPAPPAAPDGDGRSARSKAKLIPIDWQPNETNREWLTKEGLTPTQQAEVIDEFRRWARNSGHRKANWDLAFSRNPAVKSAVGRAKTRQSSAPSVAANFEGKNYEGTPEHEMPGWTRGGG